MLKTHSKIMANSNVSSGLISEDENGEKQPPKERRRSQLAKRKTDKPHKNEPYLVKDKLKDHNEKLKKTKQIY